jgi:hypothetical protein
MLDRVGAPLSSFVATRRNAITCTELVYRCFAEAGQMYDLRISGRDSSGRDSIAARATFFEVIGAVQQDNSNNSVSNRREPEMAWTPSAEPTFVTAADLSHTPNLVKVGKLSRVRP